MSDVTLRGFGRTWGLNVRGGVKGIQEFSAKPSNISITQGGKKFGDWDPTMSHIEWRTWVGGRGKEDFSTSPDGFYDSQGAWTINDSMVYPAPRWHFAKGFRTTFEELRGRERRWVSLVGTQKYMARSFTGSADDVTKIYLWIRMVGTPPGTLTYEIRNDASSEPGSTVHAQGTVVAGRLVGGAWRQQPPIGGRQDEGGEVGDPTEDEDEPDIRDSVSVFRRVDIPTLTLTATDYWVVVYDDGTPNKHNHWEVITSTSGTGTGKYSSDASTWTTTQDKIEYRITGDYPKQWVKVFQFMRGLYAVTVPTDTDVASQLYILGDRGQASGGGSDYLDDTGKTWTVGAYKRGTIIINRGKGDGQIRTIRSNSATRIGVTQPWDTEPDGSSQYVILAPYTFTEITSTGLDRPVTDVAVGNEICYFARGFDASIRRMRINADTHEFEETASIYGQFLKVLQHGGDGIQIWRNTTRNSVSRATLIDWGGTPSFGDAITVGDNEYDITGLSDYDNQLVVCKEEMFYTETEDQFDPMPSIGLDYYPHHNNGRGAVSSGLFFYFPWAHSVERLYSGTLDDLGPWKGKGMPKDRTGLITSMDAIPGFIVMAVSPAQGSQNYASVLIWNNRGFHEIWRGFDRGIQINQIFVQPGAENRRPRLWIDYGGELIYMDFPRFTMSPINDEYFWFQHEAAIIQPTIDMGAAAIPKFFHKYNVISEQMPEGASISVDYQVDDGIGGETWIYAGDIYTKNGFVEIREGDRRQIRLRLRLHATDARKPPVVVATVLEAFARTPIKRQWNMRVDTKNLDDTEMFLEWLYEAASKAMPIRMITEWGLETDVIIEPPGVLRDSVNKMSRKFKGTMMLTVREL